MKRILIAALASTVLSFGGCDASCASGQQKGEVKSPSAGGRGQELAIRAGARTAPMSESEFSEALRGEGPESLGVLADALLSQDNVQARLAGAALSARHGCEVVEGEIRSQLLKQMAVYPTPQGALLLSCREDDPEVLEALGSFTPRSHITSFGLPFPNWEVVRLLALAEAGDDDAKYALIQDIQAGERDVVVTLLFRSVFKYVRDREVLLALSESLFDDRLTFPDRPTDTDALNSAISSSAAWRFIRRLDLETMPAGGYDFSRAEKNEIYEAVQSYLKALPEGSDVGGNEP